jgi:hypothetical protein
MAVEDVTEVTTLAECLQLPPSTTSVRIRVSTVTPMESTPPNTFTKGLN